MLTARTSESDRVAGLDLGADDYVTKPFSLRELARVRAVLRRRQDNGHESAMAVYRGEHLIADFDAVAVAVDGEAVRLTRREFELLRAWWKTRIACCPAIACSSASGDTITRSRPARWTCTSDGSVPKLAQAGRQIETVVGLGYRFVEAQ